MRNLYDTIRPEINESIKEIVSAYYTEYGLNKENISDVHPDYLPYFNISATTLDNITTELATALLYQCGAFFDACIRKYADNLPDMVKHLPPIKDISVIDFIGMIDPNMNDINDINYRIVKGNTIVHEYIDGDYEGDVFYTEWKNAEIKHIDCEDDFLIITY